jgi:hypothetical protein
VFGAWKNWILRSFESGLLIEVGAATRKIGPDRHLVHLTTTLTNCGHRRLRAPKTLTREASERSGSEWILHVGDLQIRQINPNLPAGMYAEFWDDSATSTVAHLSILDEYERLENINGQMTSTIDFFMEPGEMCKVGTTLVLARGDYLAKVVVLGDRQPLEFWSQIVAFSVPGGTTDQAPGTGPRASAEDD